MIAEGLVKKARGMVAGSYKRVDDKDIKLSPTELYEIQNILRPSNDDRDIVPEATIDNLDVDVINQIIATAHVRNSKAVRGDADRAEILRRLNITDSNGDVRMAGLLVAGDYPQMFFSQAGGGCCELSRYLQIRTWKAPFSRQENLRGPTDSVVDGAGRHDEQEISREVLRGAIANALVHREYNAAFAGQAVSIEIYPDCVVIKSPGGLWGGKTVENLANGESACRDSTLMGLMRFVSLSGEAGSPAEGNGMDIDLMLREMAVKSLPAPEFHAEIDSFTVTLGRHGTEIAEFRSWLASVGCSNLPQLERAVLLAVKQAGSITVKELHDRLGYDSDEIRTALKDLSRRAVLRLGDDDAYALSNVTADAENDKPQLGDVAGEQEGDLSLPPQEAIVKPLSVHGTLGSREIANMTGRQMSNVRYHLNRLIAEGVIAPTAEATSVHRRYVLV